MNTIFTTQSNAPQTALTVHTNNISGPLAPRRRSVNGSVRGIAMRGVVGSQTTSVVESPGVDQYITSSAIIVSGAGKGRASVFATTATAASSTAEHSETSDIVPSYPQVNDALFGYNVALKTLSASVIIWPDPEYGTFKYGTLKSNNVAEWVHRQFEKIPNGKWITTLGVGPTGYYLGTSTFYNVDITGSVTYLAAKQPPHVIRNTDDAAIIDTNTAFEYAIQTSNSDGTLLRSFLPNGSIFGSNTNMVAATHRPNGAYVNYALRDGVDYDQQTSIVCFRTSLRSRSPATDRYIPVFGEFDAYRASSGTAYFFDKSTFLNNSFAIGYTASTTTASSVVKMTLYGETPSTTAVLTLSGSNCRKHTQFVAYRYGTHGITAPIGESVLHCGTTPADKRLTTGSNALYVSGSLIARGPTDNGYISLGGVYRDNNTPDTTQMGSECEISLAMVANYSIPVEDLHELYDRVMFQQVRTYGTKGAIARSSALKFGYASSSTTNKLPYRQVPAITSLSYRTQITGTNEAVFTSGSVTFPTSGVALGVTSSGTKWSWQAWVAKFSPTSSAWICTSSNASFAYPIIGGITGSAITEAQSAATNAAALIWNECFNLNSGSSASPSFYVRSYASSTTSGPSGIYWTLTAAVGYVALPSNQWTHLAVSYDINNGDPLLNIYRDGILQYTSQAPTIASNSVWVSSENILGGGFDWDGNTASSFCGFQGHISAFAKFDNKALSSAEILTLYSASRFQYTA